MNRESSIQLVYQLTLLIHYYLKFPAIELVYFGQIKGLPSAQWISMLTLQCISALLSAYSTLSLPIQVAKMYSLKRSGTYSPFWRDFFMLSKRMFQLIFRVCVTYISMFLILEDERFEYFRSYVSGTIKGGYFENFGYVLYGSIIFMVCPFITILENLSAVTFFAAGKKRKQIREIFSRFGNTLRIRVRKEHGLTQPVVTSGFEI